MYRKHNEEIHAKYLGTEIERCLNWMTLVKSLLSRLGKACYAIRDMKSYSNLTMLRMIMHAYFHPLMRYATVFWGNSSEAKNIFLLQTKTIRIIMGMKHRESCRAAFIKLNILTLAFQYNLSLMSFMINNLEQSTFNSSIYKKSMRHRRNLHVPQSHLAMRQKGVYYISLNIFKK
jgi:hypothetical protein